MRAITRYGAVAQGLHWLIAALVLAMFGLGWYMTDLPVGQWKFDVYQVHKSLGITVLGLAVIRLLWRWRHPAPPLPSTMPAWERRAAQASHGLLYVMLFLQPLIGLLQSNAANFPIVLWGALPLPALIGANEPLGETLVELHHLGASVLALLVIVHVLAALRHHFLLKDDVLRRMLPRAVGER